MFLTIVVVLKTVIVVLKEFKVLTIAEVSKRVLTTVEVLTRTTLACSLYFAKS